MHHKLESHASYKMPAPRAGKAQLQGARTAIALGSLNFQVSSCTLMLLSIEPTLKALLITVESG